MKSDHLRASGSWECRIGGKALAFLTTGHKASSVTIWFTDADQICFGELQLDATGNSNYTYVPVHKFMQYWLINGMKWKYLCVCARAHTHSHTFHPTFHQYLVSFNSYELFVISWLYIDMLISIVITQDEFLWILLAFRSVELFN